MHALFKNLVILIRARPRATPAHPPIVAHPAGTRLARAWPPVYCAVLFAHTRTPPATRHPPPATGATLEPRPLERLRSSRCPGRDWRNTPLPRPPQRVRTSDDPNTPDRDRDPPIGRYAPRDAAPRRARHTATIDLDRHTSIVFLYTLTPHVTHPRRPRCPPCPPRPRT